MSVFIRNFEQLKVTWQSHQLFSRNQIIRSSYKWQNIFQHIIDSKISPPIAFYRALHICKKQILQNHCIVMHDAAKHEDQYDPDDSTLMGNNDAL